MRLSRMKLIGAVLAAGIWAGMGQAAPPEKVAPSPYAWQLPAEDYLPPQKDYFPDDAEAGRKLDELFATTDQYHEPSPDILKMVRQGLRNAKTDRQLILRPVGNLYIWHVKEQNPEAIELMYHATLLDQYDAIYFGLSVTRPKTPAILRTLAEIGMKTEDADLLDRIAWSCKDQKEESRKYIEPYLNSEDAAVKEKAEDFGRMMRGEVKPLERALERAKEKALVDFSPRLPQIRADLGSSDRDARRAALKQLNSGAIVLVDDSFVPAFVAAAEDPNPDFRAELISSVGSRLVWSGSQSPEAVETMLKLSRDHDRRVRYNAVYYGLSTVTAPNRDVIRRLIEIGLEDHEPNLYQRCVWGLKHHLDSDGAAIVDKVLAEFYTPPVGNMRTAVAAATMREGALGAPPQLNEKLAAQIDAEYPRDLYILSVHAQQPYAPTTAELWKEIQSTVPQELRPEKVWDSKRQGIYVGFTVLGEERADAAKAAINGNTKLKLQDAVPLPREMQLYMRSRKSAGSGNR